MKRIVTLLAAAAVCTGAVPAVAQTGADEARMDAAQRRFDNELGLYRQAVDQYRASARRGGYPGGGGGGYYDPRYRDPADDAYYDPSRDYRSGGYYEERVLTPDDRIYRGTDNRYYCRRGDGTVGLLVGGGIGAVFGNLIDGGRSRTLGTLLGAGAGAAVGSSVDRNNVRCR